MWALGLGVCFVAQPQAMAVTIAPTITEFRYVITNNEPVLDASPNGKNGRIEFFYAFDQQVSSLTLEVVNPKNEVIQTIFDTNRTAGSFVWDGRNSGLLAEPGAYKARVYASTNSGGFREVSFNVAYASSERPFVDNFTVNPSSFSPEVEDASIEFTNRETSDITLEIYDSNNARVRTFNEYTADSFDEDTDHEVLWDGKQNNGNSLLSGSYKARLVLRSNYGVVVEERAISISNTSSSVDTSNAHISDIYISPSRFAPDDDGELVITFDIEEDLDELTVYAVRGSKKVEIFNENNLDNENDFEITWDGTDEDDEIVEAGTWRIQFESEIGSTRLLASKSFILEEVEINIDDFMLSKGTFDNEAGESTYVMFRLDADAEIDLLVYENNRKDDTFIEEFEVEANKWYAFIWDGDSYDSNDDLDIELVVRAQGSTTKSDSRKIAVNLEEDQSSSGRANVLNDYITPVLSDGTDSFEIGYELEKEADVEIYVYRGLSTSGTAVKTLATINDQDAGSYEVSWDGRDQNNKRLSTGVYSYKIVARNSGTETEVGRFVIGSVGEIDGEQSSGGSSSGSNGGSSSGNGGSVSSGVIIEGAGGSQGGSAADCGFFDVNKSSKYCAAIKWTKDNGIFTGYGDGSFQANQLINRAELLKVILEAKNIAVTGDNFGNAGFSDVSSGQWYVSYIKSAKDKGIFSGDQGKNTARPADYVNRVEALKLVFETLRSKNNYSVAGCQNTGFTDVSGGSWFAPYVCESARNNLFDTFNSLFQPGLFATRGEIALMLYRMDAVGL